MAVTINVPLNVPDATAAQRVLDAFAGTYGYSATLDNGTANPQSPTEFTRARIREYVRGIVTAWEADQKARAARQQAIQDQVSVT